MTKRILRKLGWAFSNRVVADDVTCNEVGYFRRRDFVDIGGELRRVWTVDNARLVLSVY